MSILAAVTENGIRIEENLNFGSEKSGFSLWLQDFTAGIQYLKGEKGLLNIYAYDAVSNGAYSGIGPIMVSFFRTTPGFSAQLYSFFSAVEFVGLPCTCQCIFASYNMHCRESGSVALQRNGRVSGLPADYDDHCAGKYVRMLADNRSQ